MSFYNSENEIDVLYMLYINFIPFSPFFSLDIRQSWSQFEMIQLLIRSRDAGVLLKFTTLLRVFDFLTFFNLRSHYNRLQPHPSLSNS